MGNKIKKDTVFIEAVALTNSSAFNAGECVGHYLSDGKWIAKDSTGKKWQSLVGNSRNENYYRFINQYSMGDIVQYLLDKVENYSTVAYGFLVEAVETALKETKVCCIDDICKYVTEKLI